MCEIEMGVRGENGLVIKMLWYGNNPTKPSKNLLCSALSLSLQPPFCAYSIEIEAVNLINKGVGGV